jgi:DNA-binding CsgD family transcriptional regulator
MSTNAPELTAILETLSLPDAVMHLSTVMPFLVELVGAREIATVMFDVKRTNNIAAVSNISILSGSLRSEAVDRLLLGRADWWIGQVLHPANSMASLLVQARENLVSDAFRFASEPLTHPKWSAIFSSQKIGRQTMSAVIGSDLDDVPPAINLALFQLLASAVLKLCSEKVGHKGTYSLTEREIECLLWSARGKTSIDIAEITGLSEHTVNHYLTNAATKLNASNRTNAIIRSIALGVISIVDI